MFFETLHVELELTHGGVYNVYIYFRCTFLGCYYCTINKCDVEWASKLSEDDDDDED